MTQNKFLILVFLGFLFTGTYGQKKDLKVSDYEKWEALGFSRSISNNGEWFVYQVTRNNDENELRLYKSSTKTETILSFGSRPQFSNNNQWLGYFQDPSPEAKKKSKSPVRSTFILRQLANGSETKFENVSSFSFNHEGSVLTMKRYPAKGVKTGGSDLVVRNLSTAKDFNFGNVAEYKWQNEGKLLALIIKAADKAGNGVQLFNPETGVLEVLESDSKLYLGLSWRTKSDDLAVFRVEKDTIHQDSTHNILIWKGLGSKKRQSMKVDPNLVSNWPEDTRIVNNSSIRWSRDGSKLFFNIKSWDRNPEEKENEADTLFDLSKEAPALQIWHSKDVNVIPEQEQINQRNRNKTYLSSWHINEKNFVQLEDTLTEYVRLQYDIDTYIGLDETPYENESMFGRFSNDVYLVNGQNGQRRKILSDVYSVYDISPDEKWMVYLKDDHYYTFNISTGESKNITESIDESFINTEDDHPVRQKPPYGFVRWDSSGKTFFLNSRYNIWQFNPASGKSSRITDGAAEKVRHRYLHFDFDDPYINTKKPLMLSLFGEWSKKSGYAKVTVGQPVQQWVWEDASVYRISKAKSAEVYTFIKERFDDSPDYFISGSSLSTIDQVSNTNPFQDEFHWGKTELIEYTNTNGKELQGILVYPANFESGKKYPMITYIYERLSNGVHRYRRPSQRDYYSPTVFSSQGYFVLMPDIVFDSGDPGISSVRTMEIAVKTVVDLGLVDPAKVGLVGHSWGGYQAGYAVTQTDIFAASVAGAGLTNLISMYGMIAWAFGGTPESYHFEVSQERMQVPPFEDIEGYVRNSPVFNVDKLNTPLLFEVGDNDKNVDWRQGIEYYNSARRAGKQFVLLVYANEGHGLRSDNNRADYQKRILAWFGHYLKGEPAEDWIEQGVPFVEQQKQLKNWKK